MSKKIQAITMPVKPANTIIKVKPMAQLIKNYNFGLPLNTPEELDNIERNLFTDDKYASSLIGYLKSQKGTITDNFSKFFTDNFIEQYNWSGTNNKQPLKQRVFIRSILFEVYKEYEKTEEQYHQSIQKAIQMSRNRINNQKMKDKRKSEKADKEKKAVKYLYYG